MLRRPQVSPSTGCLKIGAPIMVLRSPDYLIEVVNGTTCIIIAMCPNLIEAKISSGKYRGESVLIPRIPIIPSETELAFRMNQFPIALCFSMTINKSQGQTFECVGLLHPASPVFSHGQLYVALSRVGSPEHVYLYSGESDSSGVTRNVVVYGKCYHHRHKRRTFVLRK